MLDLQHLIRLCLSLIPWACMIGFSVPRIRALLRDHSRSSRALLASAGLCLLVLVVAMVGIARSAEVLTRESGFVLQEDGILEADIDRTVRTLTDDGRGNPRTVVHPLQPLLFQPVAVALGRAVRMSSFHAAQIVCMAMLFASACALFLTIWLQSRQWWLALGGALLYMFSFSFLWHSSVPESAPLAAPTVIAPYLLAALFRGAPSSRAEKLAQLSAAVLSLGVTTTNGIHALISYGLRARESGLRGRGLLTAVGGFGLMAIVATMSLSAVQARLYPGSRSFLSRSVMAEAIYTHDITAQRLGSVAVQMFGYTLAGPSFTVSDRLVKERELHPAISAELADPFAFPAASKVLLSLTLLSLVALGVVARRIPLARALLLGLAFTFALHLVYGNEFLLYSGNWTVLLCLLFTIGLCRLPKAVAIIGLPLLSAALLLHNAGALGSLRQMATDYSVRPLHFWTGEPMQHELNGIVTDSVGGVSPGIGTCGLHFVLWDPASGETSLGQSVLGQNHLSLRSGWMPIPLTEVAVGRLTFDQALFFASGQRAALRVRVTSAPESSSQIARLYVVVGEVGPAGAPSQRTYSYSPGGRALVVDGHTVLQCTTPPDSVITSSNVGDGFAAAYLGLLQAPEPNRISQLIKAVQQRVGSHRTKEPPSAEPVVALCFELRIQPGTSRELWFSLRPMPSSVGTGSVPLQQAALSRSKNPSTPPARACSAEHLQQVAQQACGEWEQRLSNVRIDAPDNRWQDAFRAAASQLALLVQEGGRPVVSPVNYGVFTRDAAYMIDALLMSGQTDLARHAISYLQQNPWSGRPYAEGDAPGHLLWVMGRYWAHTRDDEWLRSMLPTVSHLVQAIQQCRTRGDREPMVNLLGQTRPLKPIDASSLASIRQYFGSRALPLLNYGSMDANGVLYVNAVSLCGLREGVRLLEAGGVSTQSSTLRQLVANYDGELRLLLAAVGGKQDWDDRGQCCALWPCRNYDMSSPEVTFFRNRQKDWRKALTIWPYLDMDEAHNCLVAGQREAGYLTLERYFKLRSFASWKTLDEGGESLEGYWNELDTEPPWPPTVAMPHGWSLASLLALVRDSLVFEYNDTCYLLSGVPPAWFAPGTHVRFCLPTEYGSLECEIRSDVAGLDVNLSPTCTPPGGFVLRLPPGFEQAELRIGVSTLRGNAPGFHVRRSRVAQSEQLITARGDE